jgi:hypothetical protein
MPQAKIKTIGMLGFGGVAAKTQHTVLFLPELPISGVALGGVAAKRNAST